MTDNLGILGDISGGSFFSTAKIVARVHQSRGQGRIDNGLKSTKVTRRERSTDIMAKVLNSGTFSDGEVAAKTEVKKSNNMHRFMVVAM